MRQPLQLPQRGRFGFLSESMELWERGAGECCGVSTSLPPPMLELNTDCGVPVNTLTSFSSSLIFSLLLGELRSEEGE